MINQSYNFRRMFLPVVLATSFCGYGTSLCLANGFSANGNVILQAVTGSDVVTHNSTVSPFPYQTSDSVSSSGGSISSATYNLNANSLHIDFSQSFAASVTNTDAYASGGISNIQVSVDTPYVLTGHFAEIGGSPTTTFGPQLDHSVQLHDATFGIDLFNYDFNTHAGNATSDLSGPGLIGTLIAGRQYSLIYQNYIADSQGDGQSATANGFLNLQPAPEPASLSLLVTVGVGLLFRRRRV